MDPPSGVRSIKLLPHQLTDPVTPADGMFVLAHLGIPRVDPASWRLTIDGLVDRTATLDLADLMRRPRTTIEAVHNCCGSPIEPTVPTRRVANVRWTGADLAGLLAELGVNRRARFLWSHGLDGGDFAGNSVDWFVKDMPLSRLDLGGVLLAYEMNGAPLQAEHGFPVRLVVPGFYGTNSVKWLWRLQLAERRAESLFTDRFYNDDATAEDIAAGQPARRPVWAIAPEAIIVVPAPDVMLAVNEPIEISGWAWSFRGIAAVEISTDDGASFQRAALAERRGWAWQRFSLAWRPAARGEVQLSARAIEADGTAQPPAGARNAMHTVRVVVR
jgi:DMSO/TMAO reductase YedYZ molybdopterin-dependent catalytic subunit